MKAAVVAVVLAATALRAQAPPTPEQRKFLADTFARYDRSGDGKLVREEFPGSDTQFAEIDADRNGQVSAAEFEASATAGALLAAFEAARKEPRPRADFAELSARRLRAVFRFDKNRDGTVTRDEWTGSDVAFRSADLDGNGVLDGRDRKLAEAQAPAEGHPLRGFTQPLPAKDALIAKLDGNRDGTLTAEEVRGTQLAPVLTLADSNGDQRLDGAELQRLVDAVAAAINRRNAGTRADVPYRAQIPFSTWDKDKDGRLANAEFEDRGLFVRLDADRDGFVTKTEIARYQRSLEGDDFLARFDLDDDGRVTLAEFGGPLEVYRRVDRNGDGVVSKRDG